MFSLEFAVGFGNGMAAGVALCLVYGLLFGRQQ